MSEYIVINDITGVKVSSFTTSQIKSLFPFVTVGDSIDYWENLIKVSCGWAGNTLYKKV